MRAWLIVLLIVLAGCASSNDPGDALPQALDPAAIELPEGAVLNASVGHVEWVLQEVELPFTHTFALPAGATMVRFLVDPLQGSTGVSMVHDDTGRRRCNQQTVVGFSQGMQGMRSCSSITALDPPGTQWTVRAPGPDRTPDPITGDVPRPAIADIRLQFLATPVDGIAGLLNLDNLSHATHDLEPTQYMRVDSFDGTSLWVEVTLPKGDGPWPTVIASSPYNGEMVRAQRGTVPAMWEYWTQDWAKRGYAAVNVDVRGYGMSGGCVEVWGQNEQRDQAHMVDWVASQHWSDGNVGFYGQSYVGTTPVAAAVQNPAALKAIIAVAPVISAYDDWHYGGVPNGESSLSPVAYQVLTATPEAPDPSMATDLETLLQLGSGVCDPTLVQRANDPRALYDEFYEERDFKQHAADIQAAVLFTQGFEDANVKSAMIPGWFNEIQAPKLGVFGHWLHQHPARMDQEVLFLGWMDQYVKGKDIGFEKIPAAVVSAERDWHRTTDSWPTTDATPLTMGADFTSSSLVAGEGKGSMMVDLMPRSDGPLVISNSAIQLSTTFDNATPMIAPTLRLAGSLSGENGFVHAQLVEETKEGSTRVLTWGRINLALRNGYDSYDPLTPGAPFTAELPFRPTEHIIAPGSTVHLTIRGVAVGEAVGMAQPQPAVLTLQGAGTSLVIPTLPMSSYEPMPISALP